MSVLVILRIVSLISIFNVFENRQFLYLNMRMDVSSRLYNYGTTKIRWDIRGLRDRKGFRSRTHSVANVMRR